MMYESITQFLPCETPVTWLEQAVENQALLLIDHAQSEKKAAAAALSLIYRYPQQIELLQRMSKIAREELRHFEQVLKIMQQRDIVFDNISGSRYAGIMHQHAYNHEPNKLIDTLIIGAFIEARSCERFGKVSDYLDKTLADFYRSLLQSEARHFQIYLELAMQQSEADITERVQYFAVIERDLILQPDVEFRFHSGPVQTSK